MTLNLLKQCLIIFALVHFVQSLVHEQTPASEANENDGEVIFTIEASDPTDIGTATVTTSNSDKIALTETQLTFQALGSTAQVIVAIINNDIPEQFGSSTVTFTVTSQGGNTLKTEFIIMDDDIPFTFDGLPSEMTEGDSTQSVNLLPSTLAGNVNFQSTCSFETTPPNQLLMPNAVTIVPVTGANLLILPVNDNTVESDIEVTIEIRCPPSHPIVHTRKILVKDNDGGVTGDPHFTQVVVDSRTGKSERICYDIIGESNSHIFIYKHLESKISIYGKLMNDYYMHEINICSLMNNITATTNSIKIDNDRMFEWKTSDGFELLRTKYYVIKFIKNAMQIEAINRRLGNVKFEIRRSISDYSKFLDVNVFELTNYKGIDGLLGKIGNSQFEFYKAVSNNVEEEVGSVKVNGHFSRITRKPRSGLNCWLVDAKDIVYPMKLEDFVY